LGSPVYCAVSESLPASSSVVVTVALVTRAVVETAASPT